MIRIYNLSNIKFTNIKRPLNILYCEYLCLHDKWYTIYKQSYNIRRKTSNTPRRWNFTKWSRSASPLNRWNQNRGSRFYVVWYLRGPAHVIFRYDSRNKFEIISNDEKIVSVLVYHHLRSIATNDFQNSSFNFVQKHEIVLERLAFLSTLFDIASKSIEKSREIMALFMIIYKILSVHVRI